MGVHIWVDKDNKIYLDIYFKGRRRRERLSPLEIIGNKEIDAETLRLAELAKAKREQQIFSEGWGFITSGTKGKSLYDYIISVSESKRDSGRIQKVLPHIKKYGDIRLDAIDEKWVEDFQNHLVNKCSLAKSSAALYMAMVRAVLAQAVRDRLIPQNPAPAVKGIPHKDAHRIYLGPEEVEKLAAVSFDSEKSQEFRRAFLFSCFTGLRVSDLRSLTWGEIDHGSISNRQVKTEDIVTIPLNDTAAGIILDGAPHDQKDPVFPHLAVYKGFNASFFATWAKRAGVKKHLSWHIARHTFAVLSLEGGASIYTVSKLLGHSDIKTTQIYAKATDKLKREAVEGLPKMDIK